MSPVASPIPLLLVADSADTCERIASALLSAPAFYRIERVTSADLMQNGLPPDVRLALVDQTLRNARQPQVVQRLNASGIGVVALVDSHDVEALQEVVLAGVIALVATPFVDTQLWETVATALTKATRVAHAEPVQAEPSWNNHAPPASRPTDGQIVAVYGPKGGTGVSVLAANLAVALQDRCQRGVALLEVGEGNGCQAVLLNLRPERTMGDLLARFDPDDTELLNGVLTTHTSGIRVLLAPPSSGVRVAGDFLDEVVRALQQQYDFVVVDIASVARTVAVGIMHRAHAVLLVVVPEMPALQQSRVFVEQMQATMPEIQINIILNRANMPGGVPTDAIRRHLKMQSAAEIPDDPGLVSASVNRGVPVVLSHGRSGIARAIERLARDLAPQASGNGVQRLSNLAQAMGPLGKLSLTGRRS